MLPPYLTKPRWLVGHLIVAALVVGFVLPFDRLLDMTRTVPSASANLAVATTVARWENELDEAAYRGRSKA